MVAGQGESAGATLVPSSILVRPLKALVLNRDIRKKSGKVSTSTLTLVIHKVRISKNVQNSTVAFNWGWNSENHQFWWLLSFTVSFFFPARLHHCCYLDFPATIIPLEPCALNVEVQHFALSFSISYWDLIKFPYLTDITKRGVRGWRRPKERVKTGWICR